MDKAQSHCYLPGAEFPAKLPCHVNIPRASHISFCELPKTSLDAAAINVMRKKRNKVEEDNAETSTQAQTGDEETDV